MSSQPNVTTNTILKDSYSNITNAPLNISNEVEVEEETFSSFLQSIRENPSLGQNIKKLFICSDNNNPTYKPTGIFTDNELEEIIDRCPNLIELSLYRCLSLTEQGYQHLGKLSKLQFLSLSCCCTGVNDKSIEGLKGIDNLFKLNLHNCFKITDIALKTIVSQHVYLQKLSIANCTQISDSSLGFLLTLENLHALDISGCEKITDLGLAILQKMNQLDKIRLGLLVGTSTKAQSTLNFQVNQGTFYDPKIVGIKFTKSK